MYLSRIEINQHRRETMQALSSPQVMHAAVEGSFPKSNEITKRNLWRLDRLHGSLYLLLLSCEKPDFTHIVEQFGWPASEQKWETKEYDEFLGRIKTGQSWQFRLCANPVHSVKVAEGQRGKVYAHVTTEQQKQWLLNRAEKNGFTLSENNFDIIERDIKKFHRNGESVTFSAVTFEGLLAITDQKMFSSALQKGIGREKAYGCGLLTLAKSR